MFPRGNPPAFSYPQSVLSPSRLARVLLLAFLAFSMAHATSVVPPTFSELVAEAQTIVRGRVTATECRWVDSPQGRAIKTYVTFAVLRTLKGTPAETLTLELLGGELDGHGMRVEGMPQFSIGDTEIIFVSGNGMRFCPLIGMMHGRYRVVNDPVSARTYVARNDRVPLASEFDVQLPQEKVRTATASNAAISTALSVDAFETKITAEISHRAAQP
jgi:hypothetical protein